MIHLQLSAVLLALAASPAGDEVGRRIGSTHASGKYYFGEQDYLNEGAAELAAVGFRVIKVWFEKNPAGFYMWNSRWPDRVGSYVDLAKHQYFQDVFNRPFETYVLTILDDAGFHDGLPDERRKRVEDEFFELARHLLQTYRGTGKVFILSHHEGDWHLRGKTDPSPASDPSPKAIEGMIRLYNARQAGVERARRDVKTTDVRVYHAAEVNLVRAAMEGRATVINDVMPKTNCDLVSYSAWDSVNLSPDDVQATRKNLREALEYIAAKTPDSKTIAPDRRPFGDRNVFIGEFGVPEQQRGAKGPAQLETVCRATVEEAMAFGCRYVIFWQLYDNECCPEGSDPCVPVGGPNPGSQPAKTNADCRGFWLRRVDGSYSPAWALFTSLLPRGLAPPSQLTAEPDARGGIRLMWKGLPGVQHRVDRSEAGKDFRPLLTAPPDIASLGDASAKPGTSYRYRVRAESGSAMSPWYYTSATTAPAP